MSMSIKTKVLILAITLFAFQQSQGQLQSILYSIETIEKISALIQPVIVFVMAAVVGTMAYLMISIIFETVSGLNSAR